MSSSPGQHLIRTLILCVKRTCGMMLMPKSGRIWLFFYMHYYTDCSFENRLRKEAEPKALVIGPNERRPQPHIIWKRWAPFHCCSQGHPKLFQSWKWRILSQIMSNLRDLSRNILEKNSMLYSKSLQKHSWVLDVLKLKSLSLNSRVFMLSLLWW